MTSQEQLPAWSAPLHRSRPGAAHQRQRIPCQDSTLSAVATSADGVSVQLMAVADGHGGRRYWLSHVGSALACRIAIATATDELGKLDLRPTLTQVGRSKLLTWLGQDLPRHIVAAWREAVADDWRKRQSESSAPTSTLGGNQSVDETFSTVTYGTTLGLVLLTPHWWGHTGLGDWDLVLLRGETMALLVSEEEAHGRPGETTDSLCLPTAARRFAARSGLHPLSSEGADLALVLSTDGVRKSCAADTDHLALCAFLASEASRLIADGQVGETDQLDASLDHISRDGSGDDVSVAVSLLRSAGGRTPGASSTSGRSWQRLVAGLAVVLTAMVPVALVMRSGAWRGAAERDRSTSQQSATAQTKRALEQETLRNQVRNLCREPELIAPTLRQRKALFLRLSSQPKHSNTIPIASDPIGGLIERSRPGSPGLEPLAPCPLLSKTLSDHWQSALAQP